jgi:hypothetical protein
LGLRHRTSRSASHAQPPTSSAKPTIRRVGARSARPCPSLTVTLTIDVAHHDRRRGRNGREAPPSRVTSVLTDGVGRPPPGAGHSPTLIRFLARKASWHEQDPPTATPPHQRIRHFRCCLVASPGARKNSASWWRAGAVGGGGHEELSPPRTRRWRGRDLNVDHQRRAGVAWNENGNHGRSCARSGALACSPVRGPHLRKRRNSLVARLWMLSWGSRGRRFKSGRPDAGQRLDRQSCLDFGDHVDPRGMVWRALTASQAAEPALHECEGATRLRMGRQLRPC